MDAATPLVLFCTKAFIVSRRADVCAYSRPQTTFVRSSKSVAASATPYAHSKSIGGAGVLRRAAETPFGRTAFATAPPGAASGTWSAEKRGGRGGPASNAAAGSGAASDAAGEQDSDPLTASGRRIPSAATLPPSGASASAAASSVSGSGLASDDGDDAIAEATSLPVANALIASLRRQVDEVWRLSRERSEVRERGYGWVSNDTTLV